MANKFPKSMIIAAVAMALFAVGVVQRRRNGHSDLQHKLAEAASKAPEVAAKVQAASAKMPKRMPQVSRMGRGLPAAGARMSRIGARVPVVGGRSQTKRHHPKSLLRYYGISVLIGALERDSTRKAVIGGLRLAQRRA
jgi:hypothetical protein